MLDQKQNTFIMKNAWREHFCTPLRLLRAFALNIKGTNVPKNFQK